MKRELLEALESCGFKRWTNYGKDRLYITADTLEENFGFNFMFDEERGFSNRRQGKSNIYKDKHFIDLSTDEIETAYEDMKVAIKEVFERVESGEIPQKKKVIVGYRNKGTLYQH